MIRRLWNMLAWISLALFIVLVGLHAAGGFGGGKQTHTFGRWGFVVDGSLGRLQLVVFHQSGSPLVEPAPANSPEWVAWAKKSLPWINWRFSHFMVTRGPGVGVNTSRRAIIHGTRTHLMAPYWAVELFLLVLPIARWAPRFWRRRVPEPGEQPCPFCGYDLRATPDRCPECGAVPVRPVNAPA